MEITTVADDLIVAHDGTRVVRLDDLRPATTYEVLGRSVTTLPRPPGALLCRIATVNDVHFGEVECGRLDASPLGPIVRVGPGEPPYPETMSAGAAAEIAAIDVAAVIAKGDLTNEADDAELAAFRRCYGDAFGARLHAVRGNHDAPSGAHQYGGDQRIDLPGVTVALLDTTIPDDPNGRLRPEQLEWLDDIAAAGDRPILAMAHHPQWIDGPRDPNHFGLDPDSSDALAEVIARRPAIVAYTAGHTHRHRVRRTAGAVPTIEVGCVKDFPGVWAEYRVYEGGITQVVHRISTPAALSWSERCRHLYSDFGLDYEPYALGHLEDRCFNIPLR